MRFIELRKENRPLSFSISLLSDNGSCFSGDAAMCKVKWLGNRYCCIYITGVNEYYRSWEKMIQEGATTIYPAHGNILPSEKLEHNLDFLNRKSCCLPEVSRTPGICVYKKYLHSIDKLKVMI